MRTVAYSDSAGNFVKILNWNPYSMDLALRLLSELLYSVTVIAYVNVINILSTITGIIRILLQDLVTCSFFLLFIVCILKSSDTDTGFAS